jgi:trk system potassium uptake protein TrkA
MGPTSVLAGSAVAAAAWPRDTLLVSIGRGDRLIVPRGDVPLEAGDRLTVFSAPGARDALAAVLASQVAKAEEEPE